LSKFDRFSLWTNDGPIGEANVGNLMTAALAEAPRPANQFSHERQNAALAGGGGMRLPW
jgi:hypothetical protein